MPLAPLFLLASFGHETRARKQIDEEMGRAATARESKQPPFSSRRLLRENPGLGLAAISYVSVDYLRYLSPSWHDRLQPVLWIALALAAVSRVPYYRYWTEELRAAIPFLASILFMLSALLYEAFSVRFATAVLGADWHMSAPSLPDTGQWLLLALNEKLPQMVVDMLRAHIVGLHHFLMLFIMLGFSVLFNSIKAPGLGLAARYMFTMAIGRLLRAITFVSTILPSVRPWCVSSRFPIATHPHPWAQKYYVPYASDSNAIRKLIQSDSHFATVKEYPPEYRPDWGSMNFFIDILRPTVSEGSTWYHLLKKAGGGCNDLMYSGHMLVAVLTAMAWTHSIPLHFSSHRNERNSHSLLHRRKNCYSGLIRGAAAIFLFQWAHGNFQRQFRPRQTVGISQEEAYGGWTSALIWFLVLHSAQREIRERHHYTVDVIVAIYVGFLLWRMTGFIWSNKDKFKAKRLAKLDELQGRLTHAAKDSNIDEIRELLKEVELAGQERGFPQWMIFVFAGIATAFSLSCVLLAFTLTSDG